LHDLTTLFTWLSKLSVGSSTTPRIFSSPLTVTLLPAMVTHDLWLTCDHVHFVGKVSVMGQPTRPA